MKSPHKAGAINFGGFSTNHSPLELYPSSAHENEPRVKHRVALLDMDEVVLTPEKFYLEVLAEQYGLDPTEIANSPGFGDALKGETDLVDVLSQVPQLRHLSRRQLQEIVEIHWPHTEGVLNHEAINHILDLKAHGVLICAATNNFRQKCDFIANKLLPGFFDVFFSSSSLGHIKPDPRFFGEIISNLKLIQGFEDLQPQEIIFFDDKADYVASARGLGIDGRLFTDAHQIRASVHEQAYAV